MLGTRAADRWRELLSAFLAWQRGSFQRDREPAERLPIRLRRHGEINVGSNGLVSVLDGDGRFVNRRPGLADIDAPCLLADENRDRFSASFGGLEGASGLAAGLLGIRCQPGRR